jgi:hypothetical protein
MEIAIAGARARQSIWVFEQRSDECVLPAWNWQPSNGPFVSLVCPILVVGDRCTEAEGGFASAGVKCSGSSVIVLDPCP